MLRVLYIRLGGGGGGDGDGAWLSSLFLFLFFSPTGAGAGAGADEYLSSSPIAQLVCDYILPLLSFSLFFWGGLFLLRSLSEGTDGYLEGRHRSYSFYFQAAAAAARQADRQPPLLCPPPAHRGGRPLRGCVIAGSGCGGGERASECLLYT